MKLKRIKKYDNGGMINQNYFGNQPFPAGKPRKQRMFADGGNVQPMSNISLSKPYLPNTPIQIGNSMNVIAEQGANKLRKLGVMSPQAAFAYRLPQTNPLFADGGSIEAQDSLQGGLSGAGSGAAIGTAILPGVGTAIGAIGGALIGGVGGFFKGKNDFDLEQQRIKQQQANTQNLSTLPPPAYGTTFADGGGIYIKPSHRGLFTSEAKSHGEGVQEFASHVLANKDNYSSAVVKRANFAHNFGGKHADGGYVFANGGQITPQMLQQMQQMASQKAVSPNIPINVEKNELETNKGRMINDFSNKPKHPINGSINPQGNTIAQKGNTIIPAHMRTSYLNADLLKRKEMESKLKSDQNTRQQFANRKMADGGIVNPFNYDIDNSTVNTNYSPINNSNLMGNNPLYINPPKSNIDLNQFQNIPQDIQNNPTNWQPIRPINTNPIGSNSDSQIPISLNTINSPKFNSNFDPTKLIPYASNITNAILTAKTPQYANPVLNNHIALNDKMEIQPTLSDIAGNARGVLNGVAGKTDSGSIYRATAGDIYSKSQAQRNQVFANAANYKNGIDNQQILENSGIDKSNNQTVNNSNYMNTLRKMDINKSISQNVDNAASKFQGQEKDQALMDNDTKKALMVYGIFNQNGVLDRAGLEQSWPTLSTAHKAALKAAYPQATQNLN